MANATAKAGRKLAQAIGVAGAMLAAAPAQAIDYGVPLPDPEVPGFQFPTPETTINRWIQSGHDKPIYNHGWGLWTALTAPSGKPARGLPDAPVYLTWLDPAEIVQATGRAPEGALDTAAQPLLLQAPRQFSAGQEGKLTAGALKSTKSCGAGGNPDTCITVTVNYSPPAARHALENRLLLESTLKSYIEWGYKEIPDFPTEAITLKPVYKVISKNKLIDGKLYAMPVWPGMPDPVRAFGESDWNTCVYVDVSNGSKGGSGADAGCDEPSAASTYNLDDFIHIEITEDDIAAFRQLGGGQEPLAVGDHLILVAMHVTTREIDRWTWQTYWWSPTPDSPKAPSSEAIAKARPEQLTGAARHYAMSIAYQMLDPAQPLTGGIDVGALEPAFNPYLEAGFSPETFQVKRVVVTPEGPVATQYGVETNCMTCHGLAAYDPAKDYSVDGAREEPYGANFYLSRTDPLFEGTLQLDFAWSILGTMDSSR